MTNQLPMSQLEVEISQTPAVIRNQLENNLSRCVLLANQFRKNPPNLVITSARGSSDHAASFAKYLIETELGIPTSSSAPSVSSVYKREQTMNQTLFITISQSGHSPDLVENARLAQLQGAFVLGIINQQNTPLEKYCDAVLPMSAGEEKSVAATKTYIATLSCLMQLVAQWKHDDELTAALQRLPDELAVAQGLDWSRCSEKLINARSLFVVGRGLGFGIAQEAALKLKEVAQLHAEAFSAAEVKHGPLALIQADFPVLIFRQDDASYASVDSLITELRNHQAQLFVAQADKQLAEHLDIIETHPITSLCNMIMSFYCMVNQLALQLGLDPDKPRNLRKITETR